MRILYALAAALALAACGTADDYMFDHIGYNNSYTNGFNDYASQQFESAYVAYNINAIDNFTLTSQMSFAGIEAVFGFWNGGTLGAIQGYRVEFYTSPQAAGANLVGNAGHYQVSGNLNPVAWGTDGLGGTTYLVNIPLWESGITLAPGTYYVGVMAIMNFNGGGQFGITGSSLGDGNNAYQANPGNGFGSGTFFQPGFSAAYRLWIPEPASLALLSLATLIRRR